MKAHQPSKSLHSLSLSSRFQAFIIAHPWICILFTMTIVVGTSYGLTFATLNNNPKLFFAPDNPDLIYLNELETRFTSDETVVFIVHPENGDIFTAENLTLLEELTAEAWTIANSLRADSLTNFQHTEVAGDDLVVRNLVENPASLSPIQLNKIKSIALNEPNLVHHVVSTTGHVAVVTIAVTLGEKAADAPIIMADAERIRDEFRLRYPQVKLMLSGSVAFKKASEQATKQELSTTSIYGSLAILICLYVMLRNVASVLVTLVVILFSNLTALGITSWLGIEFSPTLGLAPAMILTLAVADSIHILIAYQHQIRKGLDKQAAMAESLRINMQPVFLTSITTAVGFLFLNTSESPPFREMGNMVSTGVVMALFFSVVFLPAVILVLPQQRYKKGVKESALMNGLADFVIRRRKPVFTVVTILFCVLSVFSLKNAFNDVWFEYYDETWEVRRATQFMVEEITGFHRVQFAFPAIETGGIMEPEYMQGLAAFSQWARHHPNVLFVSSFSDTIKRLNRDMNGGHPEFYDIPESRDLIAQYALMFEMSLPMGLGLENQMTFDKSAIRLNVLLGKVSSNDILAFELEARQWIADNLPVYMHTKGAGFDLLLGELSNNSMRGMLLGTALAMVVVSLMLVVALKSVKYGFLSMLPNLLPALLAFGIWGIINGEIGLSVSVVACMTLGIVVDNTVHFLSKYIRAKEEQGLSTTEAARYAFKTVGVALTATTLVLAANFGVMATSHFYPNASMGMLTAITVTVALAVNFFFFVPVLLFVDREDGGTKKPEVLMGSGIQAGKV